MRSFLCGLFLLLAAVSAHAGSPYAGQYYAVSTSADGTVFAAANLSVDDQGVITGQGTFGYLTPITITGKVHQNGRVLVYETSESAQIRFKAAFNAAGKQFFGVLNDGSAIKGAKIKDSFPEAGVYGVTTDTGEGAYFIVQRNGKVSGAVYDGLGTLTELTGESTMVGFTAESTDGLTFTGQYGVDGEVTGVYANGTDVSGDFTGTKY